MKSKMRLKIGAIALLLCLWGASSALYAHGYVFARSNEEMRDDIKILLGPRQMQVEYQAIYQGQIAPHVRLMIDENRDNFIQSEEVERFIPYFIREFNRAHQEDFVEINGVPYPFQLDSLALPGILQDSLLAPLKVYVRLRVRDYTLPEGESRIRVDPRFFFLVGDHFIELAKKQVQFTREQEARIGRYLQVTLYGSRTVQFTRTFPGRIRRDKKSVYIYGVFYDENLKKLHRNQIPPFRIELVRKK